jgi:hypothetical protein
MYPDLVSEIRVLTFSNRSGLTFAVTGAVSGSLSRSVQLKKDIWLGTMPMSLAAGMHRIRIQGDLKAEIEFAVGVDALFT